MGGSASARLLLPPLRPAYFSLVGGQKEDWNCIWGKIQRRISVWYAWNYLKKDERLVTQVL
jgi:hypothetical protein